MRRIVSAVSKISLASASNVATGIIRTKIFALVLGTAGVGVISQLTNFSGLILFISTAGVPIGITKLVSEFEKDEKWQDIYDILSRCLLLLILVGIVSLVLTFFFSNEISILILDSNLYSHQLIIVGFAFPFSVIMIVFDAYLRGLKKFNHYVRVTIINSVISLVLTITLVFFFSIYGFAISIFFSSILNVIVYMYYLQKNNLIVLHRINLLDFSMSAPFKLILRLGAASLILGVLDQFTLLFIRSILIKSGGIESNGIYQCVAGISNNYFVIFYMSISTYILPVLSEKKNVDEINAEINNAYRLTLLLIVPITCFTFVTRDFLILLLYSHKFMPASDLMLYNFAGDFFKALSWVLGAWLIPSSKIRLWLILGTLYYLNYSFTFVIMNMFSYNLKNVVIAYAVAGLIHFILNLYMIRRFNGFMFRIGNLKMLASSLIAIVLIFGLSSYNLNWGYASLIPGILIWSYLSVKIEEVKKLFSLLMPGK